jgi:hypothetical protein
VEPDWPATPWVPSGFDLDRVTLWHADSLPNGQTATAVYVAGEVLFIRPGFEEFDRIMCDHAGVRNGQDARP